MTEAQAKKTAARELKRLQKEVKLAIEGKVLSDDRQWLYLRDIADYVLIYKLVLKGKIQEAASELESLETNSREEFNSADLYNYLMDQR